MMSLKFVLYFLGCEKRADDSEKTKDYVRKKKNRTQ